MKIYADRSHYRLEDRYHLNDIVKALWNDLDTDQRAQKYGEWVRSFQYVERIEEADVAFAAMKWNYYRARGLTGLVGTAVEQARQAGKPIVVFEGYDSAANLPFTGVHVFEMAGYRSRKAGTIGHGMPALIEDPLQLYCGGQVSTRKKQARPVVGFCGQAGGPGWHTLGREVARWGRSLAYAVKAIHEEPPPFETTSFRGRVLRQIGKSAGVETNYIQRKKYRAGLQGKKNAFDPTRLAFVNNILDSDYTVCMRGGGNYSVRFYETLALGRIPVFVNTDCLLPWQDEIDYRQYCVWVEADEIERAGEMVLDFHSGIHPDDFVALQVKCRGLWQRLLCADGFYQRFSEKRWLV